MADKSKILSADAEAALLKPIDEYVGKIQSQIDALRVDGSDKVQSYKNQIAIAKEDKNLSKDERAKAVAAAKSGLEKAKSVEAANKDKVSKLIAEAEKYLSENYNSKYYDKVVADIFNNLPAWAKDKFLNNLALFKLLPITFIIFFPS